MRSTPFAGVLAALPLAACSGAASGVDPTGARGSGRVAGLIAGVPCTTGDVEVACVAHARLAPSAFRDRAGRFVAPSSPAPRIGAVLRTITYAPPQDHA